MADYTVDLSAIATANPWTPSAPLKKGSTANLQLVNGSGAKSASGGSVSYGVHDVNYTLGSTQIRAEVDIGTIVFASDRAGPAIIARSGANAGAGYAALPDNYGYIYIYKVSAAGALTQIGYIGSITLAANDLIGLGYQQSTNTLTVYQNGTSKTTVTDSTYNADTTLGAGWLTDPQNINGQYVKRLLGTGVAASNATLSSPTPSGTLSTKTTATIGATTNQASGTLYYVASTNQSKITGVTATQVKAGNGSDGVALARSGSNTVSTTSPTISATGFIAATTYYYAVVQTNANGDSNVIDTGSFTTAPTETATITWTDTNSGAAQTVIERSTDNATWSVIATVNAGTNSYANSGLSTGTYYYRVCALIGSDYSNYTSSVNVTVS